MLLLGSVSLLLRVASLDRRRALARFRSQMLDSGEGRTESIDAKYLALAHATWAISGVAPNLDSSHAR